MSQEESMEQQVEAVVLKAEDMGLSNKMSKDPFESRGLYGSNQVIEPPFPLELLIQLSQVSNILPQCIEAMATNVGGFGYKLEPTVELPKEPEEGQLEAEEQQLLNSMMEEKAKLENFFDFINYEESFNKIRKKTRTDYESVGFAFWEVLKNGIGEPAGVEHIPSKSMRLCHLDSKYTEFKQKVKTGPTTIETITRKKRFRNFVQIKGGKKVYYKEFNDPRMIDANTGKLKENLTGKAREEFTEANEVIYFNRYNPNSPYGLPRWYGQLLSLLGSRESEEVNLQYFDGKTVPPMVVMVKGGQLTDDSFKRVQQHFKSIKGKENFHSVLVLEAKSSKNSNNPMAKNDVEIEIKPLTEAMNKDALFQEYDKNNQEKVRGSFRLPPLYVGKSEGYNRATAEVSRLIAEEQVFGPEREDFDFLINRLLVPELDVAYWNYSSNSPSTSNNKEMSEMIAELSKDSGLDINTARGLIAKVFNTEVEQLEEEWAKYPPAIARLILAKELKQSSGVQKSDNEEEFIQKMIRLKKELDKQVTQSGACGQAGD